MAGLNLGIQGLFRDFFGIGGEVFEPEFNKLPARKEESPFGSKYWAQDAEGREYFMPVSLKVGAELADKLGEGAPNGIYQLPTPVISVRAHKIIIDTLMTERAGLVSELISTGAWIFQIKGFLVGKNNDFPELEMATMSRLFAIKQPVQIDSALTDLILLSPDRNGSDEVTIRSLNMPVVPGVQNVRAYEMELYSNDPFNLIDIGTTPA